MQQSELFYFFANQRKSVTLVSLWISLLFLSEAQRKYEDNCDSLHEESVSETAENSGEEAGEGALDVEAGEMTDGGEDDYDEEGSHHLVRETADRADREGESKALWEISSGQRVFAFWKLIFRNYSWPQIWESRASHEWMVRAPGLTVFPCRPRLKQWKQGSSQAHTQAQAHTHTHTHTHTLKGCN